MRTIIKVRVNDQHTNYQTKQGVENTNQGI